MSFGIFPIDTSDVEAIAQELDKIFANDEKVRARASYASFPTHAQVDPCDLEASRILEEGRDRIRRIDMASEATEKRAYVYHVQHRPAQELADLLKKLYASSNSTAWPNDVALTQTITSGSTSPAAAPPALAGDQIGNLHPAKRVPKRPHPTATNGAVATAVAAPGEPTDADLAAAQAGTNGNPSGMLARAEPDDRNHRDLHHRRRGQQYRRRIGKAVGNRRIKQILAAGRYVARTVIARGHDRRGDAQR